MELTNQSRTTLGSYNRHSKEGKYVCLLHLNVQNGLEETSSQIFIQRRNCQYLIAITQHSTVVNHNRVNLFCLLLVYEYNLYLYIFHKVSISEFAKVQNRVNVHHLLLDSTELGWTHLVLPSLWKISQRKVHLSLSKKCSFIWMFPLIVCSCSRIPNPSGIVWQTLTCCLF